MRCSICHTLIQAADARAECPSCRQEYHRSCWDELGGCATYGCDEAVPAEKPEVDAHVARGWGDEKECPRCRNTIAASYLVCRCGAEFPHADPMTAEAYLRWERTRNRIKSTRRILLALFLISLTGLPAPLTGLGAGALAYSRRDLLAGADGTHLAMGYGAAALGAVYALFAILLALGL